LRPEALLRGLRLKLHLRGHSPWIEPSSKRISKRRLRKSTTKRLLEPTTKPTKPTELRLFKATILRLLESAEL
jgi:hypothetical protein